MLRLHRKIAAQRVNLGGNAWIDVRPATQFEVERVLAEVTRLLAGIVDGSSAARELAAVLGDDFDVSGLSDRNRLAAASRRLSDAYLAFACQDGWHGIETEDGRRLIEPDPASMALLLDDPAMHRNIMAVVNARVHEETAEGNASPASPNGGAGQQTTAHNAEPAASPAHAASASTANAAQRSSLHH